MGWLHFDRTEHDQAVEIIFFSAFAFNLFILHCSTVYPARYVVVFYNYLIIVSLTLRDGRVLVALLLLGTCFMAWHYFEVIYGYAGTFGAIS